MKNTQIQNDSENEFDVDEPDEVQNNASDDDWTPENSGRRQSTRLRGSARPTFAEVSSSDELSEDEDEDMDSEEDNNRKRRSKQKRGRGPRVAKRPRVTSTTQNENSDSPGDGEKSANSDSEPSSTTVSKFGKEFSSGSFVVLKSDLKNEGDPPIWKIDGKALLQKYIPFEQDGKTYYKNTSVYSGWTVNNKHQYYPATVVFKQQNRKEYIVEFLRDQIKETSKKANGAEDNDRDKNENPSSSPKSPAGSAPENEEDEEEEEEEEEENEEEEEEENEKEEEEENGKEEEEENGKEEEEENDKEEENENPESPTASADK